MAGFDRALSRLRCADRLGPVLAVALVLAGFTGARLSSYDGNATGFVQFGAPLAAFSHPPPDARFAPGVGYDGQFYWRQAADPLLLHDSTVRDLRIARAEFRAGRLAYPGLAAALSLGQEGARPWSLLVINLLAVLALTAGATRFVRAEGRSGWWALAVGLTPGLVLGALRDLSDPLATAAVAGGLMAAHRRRPILAGALLSLAVLTREPMMLAVAALAIGALATVVRLPAGRRRAHLRSAAPAVLLPAAAFVAWQAYVTARFGSLPASDSPARQFGAPLAWMGDALDTAWRAGGAGGAWDVAYLAALLLAIGIALWEAGRRRTPLALAAGFFAIDALVEQFAADRWGYARQTAPLLAILAVLGAVRTGRSPALRTAAAAAALTLLAPLAFASAAGG